MVVFGGYFALGVVGCNLQGLWWLGFAVVGGGDSDYSYEMVLVAMMVVSMAVVVVVVAYHGYGGG